MTFLIKFLSIYLPIINARTRGNVTTCLYLSPDNRAWSLSMLMTLDVKTARSHQVKLIARCSRCKLEVFFQYVPVVNKRRTAPSVWTITPTQRSVTAKHRNRSFVGGWREVSLWRETRIRTLPNDATMDRNMFRAGRNLNTPLACFLVYLMSLVRLASVVKFVGSRTSKPTFCLAGRGFFAWRRESDRKI